MSALVPHLPARRVIKANAATCGGATVAFNFDDLRRQCDEYLESARRRGEEILSRAAAEADSIRRKAYNDGFAAGTEQGLEQARPLLEIEAARLADQLVEERLRTTIPALEEAARALRLERDDWRAVWESAAIRLSAAIAERIIRRELSLQPALAEGPICDALELAAGSPRIVVRLHPSDLARMRACGNEIVNRLSVAGNATLAPDENISPGGCLIETQHGTIDARVETQLARIVDELAGAAHADA